MSIERTKEYLDGQYSKQKPRYIFMSFNIIFGLFFIGFVIYLAITTEIKFWVVLVVIFLMLIFMASTIYTNYISKKKNRKMITHFQEETELLINEIKAQKARLNFDVSKTELMFSTTDGNLPDQTITYDMASKRFAGSAEKGLLLQLGVTCAGLAIDTQTKTILGVKGLAPCSIWIKKKLSKPLGKTGQLKVDLKSLEGKVNQQAIIKYYRDAETYYDKKTGLLVIGRPKINPLCEVTELNNSLSIVTYDGELMAVWIQIQSDLEI